MTAIPLDLQVDQHIKELALNGVTVVKKAVAPGIISELTKKIEAFKALNPGPWSYALGDDGLARRIVNLHLALPDFSKCIASSQILCATASKFFGATPRIYTSLFFEGGSQQAIHRDTPYFVTEPERRFLGVWLALEDTSARNGALEVIKGGHLVGEPDRDQMASTLFADLFQIPGVDPTLWETYQEKIAQLCNTKGLNREIMAVDAGDLIIWHPDLPHGGSQISSPGVTRKSIVFHVTPRHCPVYQMDVFFNPLKKRSTTSTWEELPVLGPENACDSASNLYVAQTSDEVSFAHVYNVKIKDLNGC